MRFSQVLKEAGSALKFCLAVILKMRMKVRIMTRVKKPTRRKRRIYVR